jgi:nucleoside-diphosphate-sugar epimerase
MSKINVLITGGAGFVGSSLASRLSRDPKYCVVVVDNLLTGKISNLSGVECDFHKLDVNDYNSISALMLSIRFDYVFHYAAVVGVIRTLENPKLVLEDIVGIRNILDLSRLTSVKRVFFSSSSEVYGEPVHLPQHETLTPLNSRLPYAVVKNVGECYFRSYYQEFGLEYTIFRFFNTYGPMQSDDFVISKFINSALINEDITIYGDGNQTRTFCFIDDNLDATINALEKNIFINDVVNIGNDAVVTINEVAKTIIELASSKSKIIHVDPLKEGDMSRRQPDITNMKILLNRELMAYKDGIKCILNFHKNR